MLNKTFSDSLWQNYLLLYHEASQTIYAMRKSTYENLRKTSGGQWLKYEKPDLLIECYVVNVSGDDIIIDSKIELSVKEVQAIGRSGNALTFTDI